MHVASAPANKIDFYKRYLAGEFGNRPRAWGTWPELRDSNYHDKVTIRDMNPGGPCFYGVCSGELRVGVLPPGVDLAKSRFNESMPDEHLTIQGNVWHDGFLQLEYSREAGIGHRDAVRLPKMKCAKGLVASSLLRTFMDPGSYADLQEMLDTYDEVDNPHQMVVIEFSTYNKSVGIIPGRNTIFWEVRNY